MYRVGLSSCGKEFSEKLFADYREAGIEAMEVSVGKTTGKYPESAVFTRSLELLRPSACCCV